LQDIWGDLFKPSISIVVEILYLHDSILPFLSSPHSYIYSLFLFLLQSLQIYFMSESLIKCFLLFGKGNYDRLFSTVTRIQTVNQVSGFCSWQGKDLSLLHSNQIISGVHHASHLLGTTFLPRGRGCTWCLQFTLYNANVMNMCCYSPTPQYAFMAWCLIMHGITSTSFCEGLSSSYIC
jgi:hypothetical protein